jgi:hypothetical protein
MERWWSHVWDDKVLLLLLLLKHERECKHFKDFVGVRRGGILGRIRLSSSGNGLYNSSLGSLYAIFDIKLGGHRGGVNCSTSASLSSFQCQSEAER